MQHFPARFLLPFFFQDTATPEIYTLSLHDALPISRARRWLRSPRPHRRPSIGSRLLKRVRSEEHTSELQSHSDRVCRLLLEKKKLYGINPVVIPDAVS